MRELAKRIRRGVYNLRTSLFQIREAAPVQPAVLEPLLEAGESITFEKTSNWLTIITLRDDVSEICA